MTLNDLLTKYSLTNLNNLTDFYSMSFNKLKSERRKNFWQSDLFINFKFIYEEYLKILFVLKRWSLENFHQLTHKSVIHLYHNESYTVGLYICFQESLCVN